MLGTYLRTAFRILLRQRPSAAISVAGLAIGLAFFALLVAFVRDDLTFDRFHAKADRTYVLTSEFRGRFTGVSHHFVAGMLEADTPEVTRGATVRYALHSLTVRRGAGLEVKAFAFADPGFFGMFSFDLVAGDPLRALAEPRGAVLTVSAARALGLPQNPLGQILSIRFGERNEDFAVTGVMRDIAGNSSLRFDGILPFRWVFDAFQVDANNNDLVTLPMLATTFIDLPDPATAASLRAKLPAFNDRLYGEMWKRVKMAPPKQGFDLLRLSDYHRGTVGVFGLASRSRPAFSWTLGAIALLVLVLACFNSLNLSLALNSSRLKEVGVRKTIGARKGQLIAQLLTESSLSGMTSLVLGLGAAALLVPSFNGLTGKRLSLAGLFHPQTLAVMAASVLAVCVFTGLIPAAPLSRVPAADALRGRLAGVTKSRLTLGLIILQFSASMVFLVGSLVMARQLRFMARAELGYDPSNILIVDTQVPQEAGSDDGALVEVFRNELRSDLRVLGITADSGTVGARDSGSITRRYDKDGVEHEVEAFLIDGDFLEVLGLPLVAGRGLSRARATDVRDGILVNESFVRDFGLADPIGKKFSDFARDKFPPEYTFDPLIVGVVKDFHVLSLHQAIGPMAFAMRGMPAIQRLSFILVKTGAGETGAVRKKLEVIWSRVRPDVPFSARRLEDALAWAYRRDLSWSRIVWWGGGFSLFIACLGLFGLTAISVVQRTKETGIRKVVGAGTGDIFLLFSRDILRWVLAAAFLSWPIAYVAARRWLTGFPYRIGLDPWMFAAASLLAFLVAGLTMSWHTLRAARVEPARSLRYE
jgi:putative ABC transport system permease protein